MTPRTKLRTLLLVILLALPAVGEVPIEDGTRILFVGNSLTGFCGGLHNYIKAACAAATPSLDITVGIAWAGGKELDELILPSETDAIEQIRSGNWDVVVLQGYNDPFIDHDAFFGAVREFDVEIKAAGARTVLYMNWPFVSHPLGSYLYGRDAYITIGAEIGAPVAPCGIAWWGLRKRTPLGLDSIFMFDGAGDVHQDDTGSGLNAYVFYAALTHQSPVGVDFTYEGFDGTTELADTLQARAWQATEPMLVTTSVRRQRPFHVDRSAGTALSVRSTAELFSLTGALQQRSPGAATRATSAGAYVIRDRATGGPVLRLPGTD